MRLDMLPRFAKLERSVRCVITGGQPGVRETPSESARRTTMKLLHTSDWHLGRATYQESRAPDHDAVIAEIIDIARERRPDVILHTGDLFDQYLPGYVEIERAAVALQQLAEIAPTVVVRGNHDSAALFRIFNRLLGGNGRLRFVDKPRRGDDGGVLRFPVDDDQVLRLAVLP